MTGIDRPTLGRYNVIEVTRISNPSFTSRNSSPSLSEAVRFWWKLGWISFGGTAAHLAIMYSELVQRRRWITSDLFFHALNFCMMLPGPEAHQLAIYIGWKLHGRAGGLIAGTLFVLPSAVILLGFSILYARFGSNIWVLRLFQILKPIVAVLVLRALLRMSRSILRSPRAWGVAVIAFCGMELLHIALPWLMAVAVIVVGLLQLPGGRAGNDRETATDRTAVAVAILDRKAVATIAGWLTAAAAPWIFIVKMGKDVAFWTGLSTFFLRTAFVTIGGSYTVMPYVAQAAVKHFHWLSQPQMLDGFALAETTPGPLIIVVGFVGFMAGFHRSGGSLLVAAIAFLLTIFYTFLPCFLFIFAGASWIERSRENRFAAELRTFIAPMVVASILQLVLYLIGGIIPASLRSSHLGLLLG